MALLKLISSGRLAAKIARAEREGATGEPGGRGNTADKTPKPSSNTGGARTEEHSQTPNTSGSQDGEGTEEESSTAKVKLSADNRGT